ncbi:MAG: hypothetical protein ABIG89_05590 [Candidatus Woesearchaeota archaeon]
MAECIRGNGKSSSSTSVQLDAIDLLVKDSYRIRSESSEPVVKRAIVSFSYNRNLTLEEACRITRKKAEWEEITEKLGRSHVFYRTLDYEFNGEPIDFVKFNLLIDGVPASVYTYLNVMQSDVEEVNFVVSPLAKEIIKECIKVYGLFGKDPDKVHITDELDAGESDSDLTFHNSFGVKGPRPFKGLEEDELILLIPGDNPYMDQESINDIIYDKRSIGKDIVLDFNYSNNMFDGLAVKYPRRNSHYHIWNPDGTVNSGKEPNPMLLNSKIFKYIGYFTDCRKNGGVIGAGIDVLFDGSDVLEADYRSHGKLRYLNPIKTAKAISRLWAARQGNMHALITRFLNKKMFDQPELKAKFVAEPSRLSELARRIDDIELVLRCYSHSGITDWKDSRQTDMVAHHDSSRLNDLDAPQDYAGMLGPVEYCKRQGLGLGYICKNAELLKAFRSSMIRLTTEDPFFAMHNAIVNDFSRQLGLGYDVFSIDSSSTNIGRIGSNNSQLNFHTYAQHEYPAIVQQMHRYAARDVGIETRTSQRPLQIAVSSHLHQEAQH